MKMEKTTAYLLGHSPKTFVNEWCHIGPRYGNMDGDVGGGSQLLLRDLSVICHFFYYTQAKLTLASSSFFNQGIRSRMVVRRKLFFP
jgi:hypothetical protein